MKTGKLSQSFLLVLSLALLLLLYNEFLVYFIVLMQCSWPLVVPDSVASPPLHALILADPHLLGSRRGHWWDKLRREWQMKRAFQTSMLLHRPDAVFVLGDLFDEGHWSGQQEFESTLDRFYSMFEVPSSMPFYVVAGNHDIGFHYHSVSRNLHARFRDALRSPSVQLLPVRESLFILINSIAMEGDGCGMCREAETRLRDVGKLLRCAERNDSTCVERLGVAYSRPVVMQHFPMYRASDANCTGSDAAPSSEKSSKFREKWECLSKEASELVFAQCRPRAVFTGHTHHGCHRTHADGTPEWTVPSFSWRNRNNPAFLLVKFTADRQDVSKCFMPEENTVIWTYVVGAICSALLVLLHAKGQHVFKMCQNAWPSRTWLPISKSKSV